MKRKIVQTRNFTKVVEALLTRNKLLEDDYESLIKKLATNPNLGDLIPGTGGIRKTRLKSATKGTSGGFRVCYFDNPKTEELFLILIYQKNVQENISSEEKKALKEITTIIKAQK